MMRFVQANKAYLPHIGGIETVVRQLAEGMVARQHSSAVVACNDGPKTRRACVNGVDVTYAGTLRRVSSLPLSPSFGPHLLRQRADVLLVHEPFLLGGLSYLTARPWARRRFDKLVVWWHSDIIRQKVLEPVYRPLLKQLLREADAVLVATPKHISSSQYLAPFAAKCHVVHFGIEPERFADTPETTARVTRIREQYGDQPLVFFNARLVYYKGAEYLVRAMEQVPNAHLVMVGKGPLRGELERLASGYKDRVTILPYLEEDELIAHFKACDIFALPSVENSEAFGIVQIEAMASGKPVITSDLETGVTYVNQHGKTGLVVPKRDADALAQAINTLLADPERRRAMGETARERVLREFTVDGMVDRMLEVCQRL